MTTSRHAEFDTYWRQHELLVYWWAHQLARSFGGAAEEYIGWLVVRFNNALFGFDPSRGGKFMTYFAKRLFSDCRRELGKPHNGIPDNVDVVAPLKTDIEMSDRFDAVWDVANRILTDRQRDVLTGRFFEGRTLKEIGERLGISREGVRQLEQRAIQRIREALPSPN